MEHYKFIFYVIKSDVFAMIIMLIISIIIRYSLFVYPYTIISINDRDIHKNKAKYW